MLVILLVKIAKEFHAARDKVEWHSLKAESRVIPLNVA